MGKVTEWHMQRQDHFPPRTRTLGVMVEEAPTSFSPFSLVDCTLLSHFSFNDFVAVAFPDLARDLDIQI